MSISVAYTYPLDSKLNDVMAALQGTGHRHMAEVCLFELGRLPGPEAENCSDRESYSLSAGLALGMITFGQGE